VADEPCEIFEFGERQRHANTPDAGTGKAGIIGRTLSVAR
jgi:hypothetical protein